MGLANSTFYHHINTLQSRRYICEKEGYYYPSLEFLQIGEGLREKSKPTRLSEPFVKELAERTGEQVQFIVEENGLGYHVCAATGDNATSIDTRLGKRIYLHANAAGKAIMAFYINDHISEIIEDVGLPALTEGTITDKKALIDELATVREAGYAFNKEEHVKGYSGVAIAVQIENRVPGAFAIGGPTERIWDEKSMSELIQSLRETANQFELEYVF